MDRDDERQTDLMLQRQAQLLADFGRTKLRDLEGEVARNIAS
jgi:hypothetical protein